MFWAVNWEYKSYLPLKTVHVGEKYFSILFFENQQCFGFNSEVKTKFKMGFFFFLSSVPFCRVSYNEQTCMKDLVID